MVRCVRQVRLQLNVNNLLDHDDPYYTGIRTLAGRNYRDATPTSGVIYVGGGGETLEVDVRVQPA